MRLTPLADRVLIKPDSNPTMTESGLHLSEHWKPEQSGIVVAIGRDVVNPPVQTGERVLFSWRIGQELRINDDTYLVMRVSDLLATVDQGTRVEFKEPTYGR